MANQVSSAFHQELLGILPRLRSYALSLAGERDRADELVQTTVAKALAQQASFETGSNLAAWLFRIQRNAWIDTFRRQRPTEEFNEETAALSLPPSQEAALVKAEFLKAFGQLRAVQREALLLSVIEGQSYEQIATHAGVSIGTIKSRVSRARDKLLLLMTGEAPKGPAQVNSRQRRATSGKPIASATPEADPTTPRAG